MSLVGQASSCVLRVVAFHGRVRSAIVDLLAMDLSPRYSSVCGSIKRLTTPHLSSTGRLKICIFLILYILTLPFQLLTTGAILEQGTKPLVVLTTILAGLVAALF